VDEEGRTRIADVVPGESCERVLSHMTYMNYDRDEILDGIWRQLRRGIERKKVKEADAKAIAKDFEKTLTRYTYLEEWVRPRETQR
jgi:arginine decarboxylase-like protein